MKKVLKWIGRIVVVLIVIVILFLIITTLYNKIKTKKEFESLVQADYYNPVSAGDHAIYEHRPDEVAEIMLDFLEDLDK